MSIPGNSSTKWAAMTSSRGMNLVLWVELVAIILGMTFGTLTRAKNSSPVSGCFTITARLTRALKYKETGVKGRQLKELIPGIFVHEKSHSDTHVRLQSNQSNEPNEYSRVKGEG